MCSSSFTSRARPLKFVRSKEASFSRFPQCWATFAISFHSTSGQYSSLSLSWQMQSEESKCACHACLISYKKFKLMLVWKLIAKWNSSSLVKLSGSFSFNSQNRSCFDEYLICAKKKQKQAITGTVRIGPIRARTPYPTSPRYQVRRYPTL